MPGGAFCAQYPTFDRDTKFFRLCNLQYGDPASSGIRARHLELDRRMHMKSRLRALEAAGNPILYQQLAFTETPLSQMDRRAGEAAVAVVRATDLDCFVGQNLQSHWPRTARHSESSPDFG